MDKHYILSNAAENDLCEIIEYTLKHWGESQLLTYQHQLESRIAALLAFPDIGRKHPNLEPNIYYIVEGKHYIFYKKIEEGILILRFLHYRMEILSHILEDL